MDYSSNILPKVLKTIKASSIVAAQDVNFHSSIDKDVGARFESSAKSLLNIANNLLKQINPKYECVNPDKNSSFVSSWKDIEETLDSSFESVEYIMDNMKKSKKETLQIFSLELEGSLDFRNLNLEKPQIHFKDPLDNHDTHPFRPKLGSKPNAIIPLKEVLDLDKLHEDYYPHPYEHEIKHSEYPKWLFDKVKEQPPNDWENTLATWVDNKDNLKAMIVDLKLLNEIAVDLEHHDYRSYYGITCLMQISNRQSDWIVDTIALRNELHALNEIFTDPQIVKVFHGANMDIVWLQRDLGIYVVSLFDTYHASKALGFPKFSLAYLLEEFAHFKTSKKYQLADWRVRPLPKVLFEYARADTHFLLNIFDQLRNKLVHGSGEKLKVVLDQSRSVACRKFEYKKFRNRAEEWSSFDDRDAESRFIAQNNIPNSQKPSVGYLMDLRDSRARELDESLRFVMPNQVLLNLCSLSKPITPESAKRALGHCADYFKQDLEAMITVLNTSQSSETMPENSLSNSRESTARHFAELYSTMKHTGSPFTVSKELLIKHSTLVPQLLKLSSLSKAYMTGNEEALKNVIKTFTGVQNTLNHDFGMAKIENEVSRDAANLSGKALSNSVTQDEIESLKPLRRRVIPPNKTQVHELESLPKFDYNEVQSSVLDDQPRKVAKRKSYSPFGNMESSGIKKPKTRNNFQTGKSTSFSKRGKHT